MSSLASDVTGPFAGLFFIALTLYLSVSVCDLLFLCVCIYGRARSKGQRFVGLEALEDFSYPIFCDRVKKPGFQVSSEAGSRTCWSANLAARLKSRFHNSISKTSLGRVSYIQHPTLMLVFLMMS